MQIIPVLDLKGGQVVRAEQGRRDRYKPIMTPLSASADVVGVAEGLRTLHPFSTLYIADLDAIAGHAPNTGALARLNAMEEPLRLWVDAGIADGERLAAALAEPHLRPVLGSESQHDDGLLERFRHHPDLILSLDFFADRYQGPASLLDQPALWPATVIVMTLARVGSATGPDLERLAHIKKQAGGRDVIAAGGVRNEADIRALASLGIAGALVATSLHDGTLSPACLESVAAIPDS